MKQFNSASVALPCFRRPGRKKKHRRARHIDIPLYSTLRLVRIISANRQRSCLTPIPTLSSAPALPAALWRANLPTAGRCVLVIDKRPHIAGNAFDEPDAHGVLVHRYGPHIFHTNGQRIFEFLSRFTEWRPYEHRVRGVVDGDEFPFRSTATRSTGLYGLDWTKPAPRLSSSASANRATLSYQRGRGAQ